MTTRQGRSLARTRSESVDITVSVMRQELERAGTFVVAVDARRSWFRYHQMFADMLQLQLRRSAPGELSALHSIAAGWYAEHGHAVEAVRHAQAAQDWSPAARLLSDNLLGLVLDGQRATARELLAGFSASAVTADAERTLALVSLGAAELWFLRTEEAERHLEQAVAPARRGGRLARRHGWTEEPIVAVAYLALGVTKVWQMRLEEAEPLLDHAELQGGLGGWHPPRSGGGWGVVPPRKNS